MALFQKNGGVSPQQVLQTLKSIRDPDLQEDIVGLNFVKDLTVKGSRVAFTIELANPACPDKDRIKAEAERVVGSLEGVRSVSVEMSFKVTRRQGSQSQTLIPGVSNTIAVASGKGGVGKSTVAANLAAALMDCGARVGLMDADVYGPSLPTLMGSSHTPQVVGNRIVPPVVHKVKMISMGYFLPKNEAVIWRGPMLHKMIHQFLGEVEWGDLDYLVIDLPPGTGDIQLSLCQTIPLTGAVIVSTPQDLALKVASKAIAMFKKLNTPILGVVENMSFYTCAHCGRRDDIFGHGGASQASREMGFPFLGEIPLSSEIRFASDSGEPTVLGRSSCREAFQAIAGAVAARVSIANHAAVQTPTIEV
ncbi:MAG: Mrp/NBP35 family ATP-binding protein [Acidobacteriota bacterium]|nr:Mrp/NBP35 family ATP-binding protein [Acidobacteriota bacterium]MDE2965757.1 Mrp/NBP35 family ATP-binding protein [Acidobacteriota bacterium]